MNKRYIIYKLNSYTPNFPPPPPPPKKSHGLLIAAVVVLIAVLMIPTILYYSGMLAFMFKPNPNPNVTPNPSPYNTNSPFSTPTPERTLPPSTVTQNHFTVQTGQKTQTATQTIGASGGNIQVTDSSNPINGLKIEVPEAATKDPVQFQVSYSTVSNINGLPQGSSIASKMISIETSGSANFNKYKMFDKPVKVTLPYDASVPNDGNPVEFYWYDSQTGKLDSAGFLSEDLNAHTITFLSGSFSDFVAIRTMLNITGSTLGLDVPVDTGFRPATDGWFIPNYGSYLEINPNWSTKGGMCLGMVSFAKWYYTYEGTGLHSKYIQGNPTEWRDDATAIQLAARAHLATSGIWNSLTTEEQGWAVANAREVALSWIAGMMVTGEPQLIGLKTIQVNGQWAAGGHAILTYAYDNGVFEIYDPNYPGSSPGDTMREIPFTYSHGFNQTYISGLNRDSTDAFNVFYHAGSKLSATPDDYKGLYDSAQNGFSDNSLFPTVTLTDVNTSPAGTTPVDTDSDGVRDTTQATATISGTITGGLEPLNSTLIYVDNQQYTADVVDGAFTREVPLMAGYNDVVILATDQDTFSNWAGYLRDTVKSTASPAAMTVTLTWDQDQSDVDLHVLEPGTDGRHIYWSNTGGGDNYPYLDMDNTYGFGPEHYYATEGMTLPSSTSLYGSYQIRVEYYADHSGADTPQTITWHLNVRYLAFKDVGTGNEFWVEESRSGALSTPESSGTGDFSSSGPAWTDAWAINYAAPNPADYGIAPPPQNVFPTNP